MIRAWVGPSLWWSAGAEPRLGETFRQHGRLHRIVWVAASDGGWVYTTEATT